MSKKRFNSKRGEKKAAETMALRAAAGSAAIMDWGGRGDPDDQDSEVLIAMGIAVLEAILGQEAKLISKAKVIALGLRAAYNFGRRDNDQKQAEERDS